MDELKKLLKIKLKEDKMLERFYPNEYLDSVYDIDFEMYYKQGIRGIIS